MSARSRSEGLLGLRADLHRHLLGSARASTLWELARKYKLVSGKGLYEQFRNEIVHRGQPKNLEEYIRPWNVFREIIRTPEDVERIALEAAEDAHNDGVCYVEFRSTLPGMPATDGRAPQTKIPTAEFLLAIREGFSKANGVACLLIASV